MENIKRRNFIKKSGLALAATGIAQQINQDSKIFNHGHDVCVDEDLNLYICQWNANKSYLLKLERF